jgi:hypothetical protein
MHSIWPEGGERQLSTLRWAGALDHEDVQCPPQGGYSSRFVPISHLIARQKLEMAHLYLSSYESTSESVFLRDLEAKDEALLVHAGEQLIGFTTLRVFWTSWQGAGIRVVYSGDTVVDRQHWGQQALAFAWIQRVGELRRAYPGCPLYWFLLVKGHRTFRFLPAFARTFYPHWRQGSVDLKPLADALALEMFPDDYNLSSGVVEFEPSRGQLKSEIAQPTAAARSREEVRFFLARNPGYIWGHELVCLCELDEGNLKPLARRLFLKQHYAA